MPSMFTWDLFFASAFGGFSSCPSGQCRLVSIQYVLQVVGTWLLLINMGNRTQTKSNTRAGLSAFPSTAGRAICKHCQTLLYTSLLFNNVLYGLSGTWQWQVSVFAMKTLATFDDWRHLNAPINLIYITPPLQLLPTLVTLTAWPTFSLQISTCTSSIDSRQINIQVLAYHQLHQSSQITHHSIN